MGPLFQTFYLVLATIYFIIIFLSFYLSKFFGGLESCSGLTDDSRLRLLVIINRLKC